MFFLNNFWDDIGGAIIEALRSLMLSLCEVIYKFIVFFFDIFMALGNAEILNNSTVDEFYNRVGLIIGLFMIFRVMISLIQYIINPDIMFDKQKGLFNITKRVIVVIVLLGATSSLFDVAYDVQKMIIDSNVIPRIITGRDLEVDKSGKILAWYAFSSFYSINEEVATLNDCPYLSSGIIESYFMDHSSLKYAYNCLNNNPVNDSENYIIDFEGNGFIAVLVGAVILWMIVIYCIQVGIRVVQLAYLELVAPIPIISYLTPKGDDTLNKWIKQCTSTYLDFFIRVAVIYFVIFIVDLLMDAIDRDVFVGSLTNVSESQLDWIVIIMILALLVFASKVPKLLKEIFPSLGNAGKFDFSLSPKKVFNDTLAARAIGATVGVVGAGASNAVHGYMNMRKAWKANGVDKKWSNMSDKERRNFARTWGKNNIKNWDNMTEEQKNAALDDKSMAMARKAYNAERSAQVSARNKAVGGAGVKTVASIVGGQVGGAVAGLKTTDITKSGDAIKTANEHRENRELREQAGYHWYNPLPAMGDKILEFSGDRTADDMKKIRQTMVDERERQRYKDEGEDLYKRYSIEKTDENGVPTGELTLNYEAAFSSPEYRQSYDKVKKAKKAIGIAEAALESERANQAAAYNSGEPDKIAIAEARMQAARDNLKTQQTILEEAQKKHDANKVFYKTDADKEAKYKYYADNFATKLVDVEEEGRKAAEKFSVDNVAKTAKPADVPSEAELANMMRDKRKDIEKQEEVVSQVNQELVNAMATGDHDSVESKKKEYADAERILDEQYEQLSYLNELSGNENINTTQQTSSNDGSNAQKENVVSEQNGVNPKVYTIDDLNKAEAELRRYELKQRFGQATDVEVYQKKLVVDRIRQWLDNNNNNNN